MTAGPEFTTTSLVAAASSVLEQNGYRQVRPDATERWPGSAGRVYEDPYSVAAVLVYETWRDLADEWPQAQAALAELMSAHFGRDDAKAWEAYLVLLTPSVLPSEAHSMALDIRRDTAHVRKLLATGEELQHLADIERALLPLLPLPAEVAVIEERSVLDLLPGLLSKRGVSESAVRVTTRAFLDQEPIVESLHRSLTEGQT